MATFINRQNKDGSITTRVMFRRKGRPTFCTCFNTKTEAEKFVKRYEKEYCLDPEGFVESMKKNKLERAWMRKFKRKVSHEN